MSSTLLPPPLTRWLSVTDRLMDVPPVQRYWVIPGKNGFPRWLLPERVRDGWSVIRQWQPYDRASFLKWQVLRMNYRLGLMNLMPGVRRIGITALGGQEDWEAAWRAKGWDRDGVPAPVFYVGTPSPTSKLVGLLVNTSSTKPEQVVKFPLGNRAEQNILHEFQVLSRLHQEKPYKAPAPLFSDTALGLASQQYVSTRPLGRTCQTDSIDFLLDLPGTVTDLDDPFYKLSVQLAAYREGGSLPDQRDWAIVERLLEKMGTFSGEQRVWVHGDFAPWNIRRLPDGRLFLVDWEDAVIDGLPLQDIFHFFFIQSFLAGQPDCTLEKVAKLPGLRRYEERFQISKEQVRSLYAYYRLNFLARCLQLGQLEEAQICLSYLDRNQIEGDG